MKPKLLKDLYIGHIILVTIAIVGLCACCSKSKDSKPTKTVIGKYLYLDCNHTLHVNQHCIAFGGESYEVNEVNKRATRIETKRVTINLLELSCSRCISDETYEELKTIADLNM